MAADRPGRAAGGGAWSQTVQVLTQQEALNERFRGGQPGGQPGGIAGAPQERDGGTTGARQRQQLRPGVPDLFLARSYQLAAVCLHRPILVVSSR